MTTDSTPTTPSPRLRLVATGSRLLVGVLVAVALVAGVVLAVRAPLPTVHQAAAHTVVHPDAGQTVLVCSGPFLALGREGADALQIQVASPLQLTDGSDGAAAVRSDITAAAIAGEGVVPVFSTEPDAASPPLIAAAGSATMRDEDLAGFAAAPCRPASMQAWLVGGSASVGASDVITLANASDVPSAVTLTIYGEAAPTVRDAVVPARTQIAVPLASAAIGERAPVVHIAADGAPVRAGLQSSLVRTLDPGGIDVQDDAGAPALEHVLAGVQVFAPGGGEVASQLRLMATQDATEARVTVRAAGAGAPAGEPIVVPLEEHVPVDLGFPGLPAGTYSVEVVADAPVVAAVWQATGFDAGSDFAWMTPAPVLSGETAFAVPGGAAAHVHVVDAAGADQEITVTELGGAPRTVTLPADDSVVIPVRAGAAYSISSDADIRVAVMLAGTDALAGWPLWPEASRPVPMTVYP